MKPAESCAAMNAAVLLLLLVIYMLLQVYKRHTALHRFDGTATSKFCIAHTQIINSKRVDVNLGCSLAGSSAGDLRSRRPSRTCSSYAPYEALPLSHGTCIIQQQYKLELIS